MIDLIPIEPDNLHIVAELLFERNGVSEAYVRWKYEESKRFEGVIAMAGNAPVGCLGVVPRTARTTGGRNRPCGWLEDLYVRPHARGTGVGTQMLRAIAREVPFMLGHPSPQAGRSILLANRFCPIPFQSRRRVILRRYRYERMHTRHAAKALALSIWRRWEEQNQRWHAARHPASLRAKEWTYLEVSASYRDWMFRQPPARFSMRRRFQTWLGTGLEIQYSEEDYSSGDRRRRVLYAAGGSLNAPESWRPFLEESREADCVFVELFTTDPQLDRSWMVLGAVRRDEAPVLVRAPAGGIPGFLLHGWDRGDWTFL